MLAFDHAIVVTPDVDATAADLLDRYGLAAVPGGAHPGHGTANRIVPLGSAYLELMYVADEDEAAGSAIGRWALDRARRGSQVGALMVRVEDVTSYAERLDQLIVEVSRTRSDGVELSWRLTGLDVAFSGDPRPAFVECRMPLEHHPGRDPAPHRTAPDGIAWMEFGGDPDLLAAWLGPHDLDLRATGGPGGPGRIAVATAAGDVVIGL